MESEHNWGDTTGDFSNRVIQKLKTDGIRRTMQTTLAITSGTLATKAINIPIDATRNLGISIRGVEVQRNVVQAASKYFHVGLSTDTPAAFETAATRENICRYSRITPAGYITAEEGAYLPVSPPQPVFQDEICLWGIADENVTIYVRIIYSMCWLSKNEMLSVLKNRII